MVVTSFGKLMFSFDRAPQWGTLPLRHDTLLLAASSYPKITGKVFLWIWCIFSDGWEVRFWGADPGAVGADVGLAWRCLHCFFPSPLSCIHCLSPRDLKICHSSSWCWVPALYVVYQLFPALVIDANHCQLMLQLILELLVGGSPVTFTLPQLTVQHSFWHPGIIHVGYMSHPKQLVEHQDRLNAGKVGSSKTSLLVILSCHLMSMIECRHYSWKHSNNQICFLYRPKASDPYRRLVSTMASYTCTFVTSHNECDFPHMILQVTKGAVSFCQMVVYILVHGCIIGDHSTQVGDLFNSIEFVPINADHGWVVVGMQRFLVHHLSPF